MAEPNDTLESRSTQEKYPKTRQLTVLETVIESNAKVRTVGITYVPVQLEPCIILRGKWLRDAGFDIGQKITVTVESDELLITHNLDMEDPLD